MISTIVSRLVILVFGTLYPAYASYKAVRTKNVKEYVKWMMYWIVFALFTCVETFTDVFFSFWFPFYYEIKIVLVVWLLSPATKGSSILYRKFVHPMLSKREQEIDEYISRAKEQGYHTVLHLGSKGVTYATNVIMQTAIKGGGGIVNHLRRSYSLSDLSSDSDLIADVNRNRVDDGMDTGDSPREIRQRLARKATGSHVDLYFPEMDVDLRSHSHTSRELPISLSQIRSSEDISSGYSSADPLFTGEIVQGSVCEGAAPLVRTASVGATRARARGGRVTIRKAPTTAEDPDNEDDFLAEDYTSRSFHNSYTIHPIFTLYPELLSMFPTNSPNFLSPEATEILMLKEIHTQSVQKNEETICNPEPGQNYTSRETETIIDTIQSQVKEAIKIDNVDNSSENINLVEENISKNICSSMENQSEKEPTDNGTISLGSGEEKSKKNVQSVRDDVNFKEGLSINEIYPADLQQNTNNIRDNTDNISTINDNKCDEIFDKRIDFNTEVVPNNIKENENSMIVIPNRDNIQDNDGSSKEEANDSDDDIFLDVEPEIVQSLEDSLNLLKSNNVSTGHPFPNDEQNGPTSQEFVDSHETKSRNEPTIKIHNEHNEQLLQIDKVKDSDISSNKSHPIPNDVKVEDSDIESVGSLTDDYVKTDEMTLAGNNNKNECERKGKYGKLRAPLPPPDSIMDENILLPMVQPYNTPLQHLRGSKVSSKDVAGVNNEKELGAPDIISQLGEGSKKPNIEKLKLDFFNEKKLSFPSSSYDVSKKCGVQHTIVNKEKFDSESVSSIVLKENEKKDDCKELKNKPKSESSGMSRFFPKSNMPNLFGMWSQKDENTSSNNRDKTPDKFTVDYTEKIGKQIAIRENNITVQNKEKAQGNIKLEENIENLFDISHEESVDKSVEEKQGKNKIVKIREMSHSPSSHPSQLRNITQEQETRT